MPSSSCSTQEPLDLMLVIGGYNSSNTCNLARICAARLPTYHIAEPDCLRVRATRSGTGRSARKEEVVADRLAAAERPGAPGPDVRRLDSRQPRGAGRSRRSTRFCNGAGRVTPSLGRLIELDRDAHLLAVVRAEPLVQRRSGLGHDHRIGARRRSSPRPIPARSRSPVPCTAIDDWLATAAPPATMPTTKRHQDQRPAASPVTRAPCSVRRRVGRPRCAAGATEMPRGLARVRMQAGIKLAPCRRRYTSGVGDRLLQSLASSCTAPSGRVTGSIHVRRRFRPAASEDERAVAEPRVRHRQAGLVDDAVAVEDQVEIERPRRARERPVAAALAFDGEQRFEQLPGRERASSRPRRRSGRRAARRRRPARCR